MNQSFGRVRPFRAAGLGLMAALLVVAAACSSSAATAAPAATESVAAASESPTPPATPTAVASESATPSAAASATAAATSVPTPLPALAVGLCTGSQLKLTITAWYPDGGSGVYAHVTAKNKSSVSCNMRGSSQARIANGSGLIIGDAGAAAAKVLAGDPTYALPPGGEINTIIRWYNWCKPDPTQKVFVAMLQPFGLGHTIAAPLGNAPIPDCWLAGQKTQVSSEDWLP